MFFTKTHLVAAVAAVSAFAATSEAALFLKLTNGAATVTITDNGFGDILGTVNSIGYFGALGDYSLNITTGTTNNPGNADFARLQVQSISTRNSTAGQSLLTIEIWDTNFTAPAGPNYELFSSYSGTETGTLAGDSLTYKSFADPFNAPQGTTVSTPLQAFISSGAVIPNSFNTADETTLWVDPASPYSLYSKITLNLSQNAQANVSGTTEVRQSEIPEPASLSLLALGAAGLLLRRRN